MSRDVDIGRGLMLNWWVHLACKAWAYGDEDEFYDALERAFEDLKCQDNPDIRGNGTT